MSELLQRIQSEARGTSAHGMIVDYLKEKRHQSMEQMVTCQAENLAVVRAQVQVIDAIILDLTREPPKLKPVKTGGYTI